MNKEIIFYRYKKLFIKICRGGGGVIFFIDLYICIYDFYLMCQVVCMYLYYLKIWEMVVCLKIIFYSYWVYNSM